MARDGANPIDLTIISIYFIVFVWRDFRQNRIIDMLNTGLNEFAHNVLTELSVLHKIKTENPELHQKIMSFLTETKE